MEGKTISGKVGFTTLRKMEGIMKTFDIAIGKFVTLSVGYVANLEDKELDRVIGESVRLEKLNDLQVRRIRAAEILHGIDEELKGLQ